MVEGFLIPWQALRETGRYIHLHPRPLKTSFSMSPSSDLYVPHLVLDTNWLPAQFGNKGKCAYWTKPLVFLLVMRILSPLKLINSCFTSLEHTVLQLSGLSTAMVWILYCSCPAPTCCLPSIVQTLLSWPPSLFLMRFYKYVILDLKECFLFK